jgi:hypothetical protein
MLYTPSFSILTKLKPITFLGASGSVARSQKSYSIHILHQSVARAARHTLVRVSAAQRAAETRQIRKVQDLSQVIFVRVLKDFQMGS